MRAFPSATQNEITAKDAANLIKNGIKVVAEGATMPSTLEATKLFLDAKVLYGPAKAANAGGVATSGLEMSQNSARISWTREEVDDKLYKIYDRHPRSAATQTAEKYGLGNLVNGAVAGFLKVAETRCWIRDSSRRNMWGQPPSAVRQAKPGDCMQYQKSGVGSRPPRPL